MPKRYNISFMGADGGIQNPVSYDPFRAFSDLAQQEPTAENSRKIFGISLGQEPIYLPRLMPIREAAAYFSQGEGKDLLRPAQKAVLEAAQQEAKGIRANRATRIAGAMTPVARSVVAPLNYSSDVAKGATAALMTGKTDYLAKATQGKGVNLGSEGTAVQAVSEMVGVLPGTILGPAGIPALMAANESRRQEGQAIQGKSVAGAAGAVGLQAGLGLMGQAMSSVGAKGASNWLRSSGGLKMREALGLATQLNKGGSSVRAGKRAEVANRIVEAVGATLGGEAAVMPMTMIDVLEAHKATLNHDMQLSRARGELKSLRSMRDKTPEQREQQKQLLRAVHDMEQSKPLTPAQTLLLNTGLGAAFGVADLASPSITGRMDAAGGGRTDLAEAAQAGRELTGYLGFPEEQMVTGERMTRAREAGNLQSYTPAGPLVPTQQAGDPDIERPSAIPEVSPEEFEQMVADAAKTAKRDIEQANALAANARLVQDVDAGVDNLIGGMLTSADSRSLLGQVARRRGLMLMEPPEGPAANVADVTALYSQDIQPRLDQPSALKPLKARKRRGRAAAVAQDPDYASLTPQDARAMSNASIVGMPVRSMLEIEDIEAGQIVLERKEQLLDGVIQDLKQSTEAPTEAAPEPVARSADPTPQPVAEPGPAAEPSSEPRYENVFDNASALAHRKEIEAYAQTIDRDSILDKLRQAYREIDDPFLDVPISQVARVAGVPMRDARATIFQAALDQDKGISISEGDWSMSPEEVREGVIWSPGPGGRPKHFMKVRMEDPKPAPDPSDSPATTAPEPVAQPEPPRPGPPTAGPPPRISGAIEGASAQGAAPSKSRPTPLTDAQILALTPDQIRAIEPPELRSQTIQRINRLREGQSIEQASARMRSVEEPQPPQAARQPEAAPEPEPAPLEMPEAIRPREMARSVEDFETIEKVNAFMDDHQAEMRRLAREASVDPSELGLGIASGANNLQSLADLLRRPIQPRKQGSRLAQRAGVQGSIGVDARFEAQKAKGRSESNAKTMAQMLTDARKAWVALGGHQLGSKKQKIKAKNAFLEATNHRTIGPAIYNVLNGVGRGKAKLQGADIDGQNLAATKDLMALERLTSTDFARAIGRLREHIDDMSTTLLNSDLVDEDMKAFIRGNLGQYRTRAYRARTESNPWRGYLLRFGADKTGGKRKAFRDFIRNNPAFANDEGVAPRTDAEVDAIEKDFITGRREGRDAATFLSASAKISEDILKHRSTWLEDNPLAREALGEYTDPIQAIELSAAKMMQTIARDDFYRSIKPVGLQEGWLLDPSATTGTPGYEKLPDSGYGAISGMYIRKRALGELKDAFAGPQDKLITAPMIGPFLRAYMSAVRAVKIGKTGLNPLGWVRNGWGGGFLSYASGHGLTTESMKDTFEIMRNSRNPLAKRARELGLWQGDIRVQEIARDAKDADSFMDALTTQSSALRAGRKAVGGLMEGYQAIDVFWKINGWRREISLLRAKAEALGQKVSDADLEEQAAKKISNLYPNYDALVPVVRKLRRLPVGTFASFPAEMARNSAWAVRYMLEDAVKTLELKSQGHPAASTFLRHTIQKNLGFGLASAGVTTLLDKVTSMISGVDEEHKEAYRQLTQPWNKESNFLWSPNWRDSSKEGEIRHIPLNYLDPYEDTRAMILAIPGALFGQMIGRSEDGSVELTPGRAFNNLSERLMQAADKIVNPYLSTDIAFRAIVEPLLNKQGRDIYLWNYGGKNTYPVTQFTSNGSLFGAMVGGDSIERQGLKDMLAHSLKIVRPGAFSTWEQLFPDDPTRATVQQFRDNVTPEDMSRFVGLVPDRVTPDNLKYTIQTLRREVASAERAVRELGKMNDGRPDPDKIAAFYLDSERRRFQQFQDARRIYRAMKTVGFAPEEVNKMVVRHSRDKSTAADIMSGRFQFYSPGEGWFRTLPRETAQAVVQAIRIQRQRIRENPSVLQR